MRMRLVVYLGGNEGEMLAADVASAIAKIPGVQEIHGECAYQKTAWNRNFILMPDVKPDVKADIDKKVIY